MKKCSTCKIFKETGMFGNSSGLKDGLRSQCKECESKTYKKYYTENRQKCINKTRKYRENNRKECLDRTKKWAKNNPAKKNAIRAKYRAVKLNAALEGFDKEIEEVYQMAKDLQWLSEEALHVDHIVPLQGKTVCGLHVPWNLQIITASKNQSKSNKLIQAEINEQQ